MSSSWWVWRSCRAGGLRVGGVVELEELEQQQLGSRSCSGSRYSNGRAGAALEGEQQQLSEQLKEQFWLLEQQQPQEQLLHKEISSCWRSICSTRRGAVAEQLQQECRFHRRSSCGSRGAGAAG